jgi:hypothetical protein
MNFEIRDLRISYNSENRKYFFFVCVNDIRIFMFEINVQCVFCKAGIELN